MKDIAPTRYDEDTVAWAQEQTAILRAGNFGAVDWANVIEEIESVGVSERHRLKSALALIIEHMLKLDHGKARDPERGWRVTIATQQAAADRVLEENPSLRRELSDLIVKEYRRARKVALKGFEAYEPEHLRDYRESIPDDCPYSAEDVLGS